MTHNNILPYPFINALLNPHQRNFFLQYTGINTETHDWTMYVVSEFGALSPKYYVFNNPFHSRLGDLCRRDRKTVRTKVMDNSKEKAPSVYNRTGVPMNLQRLQQYTQVLPRF